MIWPEAKITSVRQDLSMKARFAQATQERDFAEQAQNLMKSQAPLMERILLHTLAQTKTLYVNRSLKFQTSELSTEQEDPDNFYFVRKSQESLGKYVDVVKEIPAGTTLMLKSLDPTMQEFIFLDQHQREWAIPYVSKPALCTQTHVYELTQELLARQPQ